MTSSLDPLRVVAPRGLGDAAGCLTMNERAVHELADRHGTPVYLMDETDLHARMDSIDGAFGFAVRAYAAKAFWTPEIARTVAERGWWTDVVSLAEAIIGVTGGVAATRMLFHGNAKSLEEIAYIAQQGIGRAVIDHRTEIDELAAAARAIGHKVDVLIRLNIDVGAVTHRKVQTSGPGSHFGVAPEDVDAIVASLPPEVVLRGFHTHLGSQIADPAVFALAADRMVRLVDQHRRILPDVPDLDLGGGFPVPYVRGDAFPELDRFADAIASTLDGYDVRPFVEPGRAVTARSTIAVYTVRARKGDVIAVDGGMSDNPRHALYGARYEAVAVERIGEPHETPMRVVGRHCETGDVLAPDVRLPARVGVGDRIALLGVGAYTLSMASNYNLVGRPSAVLVGKTDENVMIRRESLDDLLARYPGYHRRPATPEGTNG